MDVNINLIGQHFEVNLGKLCTFPLKLLKSWSVLTSKDCLINISREVID